MTPMATQLAIYERMSALSARMVEAARGQDWDRLVELERQVGALRDMLSSEGENNESLSASEREKKTVLIQRILRDDAEIRRHTEPWMEHVRQFLGGNRVRRNVERAYGVGGGLGA